MTLEAAILALATAIDRYTDTVSSGAKSTTKKTKETPSTTPAPAPTPAPTPDTSARDAQQAKAPAPAPTPAPTPDTSARDALLTKARSVAMGLATRNRAALDAILAEFSVSRISDIPETSLPMVIARMNEL
jgi:cell division septation protein DedD